MLKFGKDSSLRSCSEGVSSSVEFDPSETVILSPAGDTSLLARTHVLTSEESEQAAHWKCKFSLWDGGVAASAAHAAQGKCTGLAGGNPHRRKARAAGWRRVSNEMMFNQRKSCKEIGVSLGLLSWTVCSPRSAESAGSNRCRNGSNFRCEILCKSYCRNGSRVWAANVQLLLEAYGQGAGILLSQSSWYLQRSSWAPLRCCSRQLSSAARVGTEISSLHLRQQNSKFQTLLWKIKEYLVKYPETEDSQINNHF